MARYRPRAGPRCTGMSAQAEAEKWRKQTEELQASLEALTAESTAEHARLRNALRAKDDAIELAKSKLQYSVSEIEKAKELALSAQSEAARAVQMASGSASAGDGEASSARSAAADKRKNAVDDVERLFYYFDADGSGSLDLSEFKLACLLAFDDGEMVEDVFVRLDRDGNGPSRAKSVPRSLRRALLMPQDNTGSVIRCGKRT